MTTQTDQWYEIQYFQPAMPIRNWVFETTISNRDEAFEYAAEKFGTYRRRVVPVTREVLPASPIGGEE
ncbi:hypothetical protein J2X72_001177 [Phyllobacterium sp. 1468]|uniref:hypothetical protein n=1 Tax=Phyllobacterium sp. 1468 TaxID=2817759 RepID=UPI002861CE73|nr:hypothetical protein [Phyllobacterium sp. 1468]MDR6632393.1 hypothetical protein [Phyllobacterium sp. 1468]